MNNYVERVHEWTAVCSMVNLIPLEEIAQALQHVNHIETIAPLLEPTGWMRGGGNNLREQKEFLEALLAFRQSMEKMRERLNKRKTI